jgi:hypothetical protein
MLAEQTAPQPADSGESKKEDSIPGLSNKMF